MNESDNFTTNSRILAFSWNIATDPKLYWELASNPYTLRAAHIISERFPGAKANEIIRAAILAETEGEYDRNFRLLDVNKQSEEEEKQNAISTEIHKRLAQNCNAYVAEFAGLPKEFVYDSLSRLVFETADIKEIERKFSLSQRHDYRLSIVEFIESIQISVSDSRQKGDDRSVDHLVSSKHSIKFPRLIAVLSALFLIPSLYLARGLYIQQAQKTARNPVAVKQVLGIESEKSPGLPVRLIIPRINLAASVQYVGLTSNGAMDVPTNTTDVGWFNLGARPGAIGSAVIGGHLDGNDGEPGVFTNLNQLKNGDPVYIQDDKGVIISFIVQGSRLYDPGYAEEVFSQNDNSHLNLVTCDGVWDGTKKSYSKRLVVYADLSH